MCSDYRTLFSLSLSISGCLFLLNLRKASIHINLLRFFNFFGLASRTLEGRRLKCFLYRHPHTHAHKSEHTLVAARKKHIAIGYHMRARDISLELSFFSPRSFTLRGVKLQPSVRRRIASAFRTNEKIYTRTPVTILMELNKQFIFLYFFFHLVLFFDLRAKSPARVSD